MRLALEHQHLSLVNAGQRVPNSAMMAILGRMAGYTGQIITWDQAINSKEDTFPQDLTLTASMPTPPVAVPGITKFV